VKSDFPFLFGTSGFPSIRTLTPGGLWRVLGAETALREGYGVDPARLSLERLLLLARPRIP